MRSQLRERYVAQVALLFRAMTDPFENWISKLFQRWLGELTHQEIARALKALTRDYVQRRTRLRGKALEGRGKQAAFACYYAPRHFVIVREVLKALGAAAIGETPMPLVDLGCGSGVAGAAWALHSGGNVVGVELDPDVAREAAFTFKDLGVRGGIVRCHIARYRWPKPPLGIVAAFTINELDERDRERLWRELERQIKGGSRLLVLEPLATGIAPWWQEWSERVRELGGRADEWHFEIELPERVHLLGKSAGLKPEKLGARTLWVEPRPKGRGAAEGGNEHS
ncbi:MAG: class I SAM-dependent methyltransferase [Planctomycetota bacterium]|nr:class I SAM-dependent methyltransferase [Planctomycetota bacterium]